MSYKAEIEKFKSKRAKKKLNLYRYLYKDEDIITVSKAIIDDLKELNIDYKTANTIYNPFDFNYIREKGKSIDIGFMDLFSLFSFLGFRRLPKKDFGLLIGLGLALRLKVKRRGF